jgi:hypothetical protein
MIDPGQNQRASRTGIRVFSKIQLDFTIVADLEGILNLRV